MESSARREPEARAGWLRKKGTKGPVKLRQWRRRWVVLDEDVLAWHDTPGGKLRGSLMLSTSWLVRFSDAAGMRFEIGVEGEVHAFNALDLQDSFEWFVAFASQRMRRAALWSDRFLSAAGASLSDSERLRAVRETRAEGHLSILHSKPGPDGNAMGTGVAAGSQTQDARLWGVLATATLWLWASHQEPARLVGFVCLERLEQVHALPGQRYIAALPSRGVGLTLAADTRRSSQTWERSLVSAHSAAIHLSRVEMFRRMEAVASAQDARDVGVIRPPLSVAAAAALEARERRASAPAAAPAAAAPETSALRDGHPTVPSPYTTRLRPDERSAGPSVPSEPTLGGVEMVDVVLDEPRAGASDGEEEEDDADGDTPARGGEMARAEEDLGPPHAPPRRAQAGPALMCFAFFIKACRSWCCFCCDSARPREAPPPKGRKGPGKGRKTSRRDPARHATPSMRQAMDSQSPLSAQDQVALHAARRTDSSSSSSTLAASPHVVLVQRSAAHTEMRIESIRDRNNRHKGFQVTTLVWGVPIVLNDRWSKRALGCKVGRDQEHTFWAFCSNLTAIGDAHAAVVGSEPTDGDETRLDPGGVALIAYALPLVPSAAKLLPLEALARLAQGGEDEASSQPSTSAAAAMNIVRPLLNSPNPGACKTTFFKLLPGLQKDVAPTQRGTPCSKEDAQHAAAAILRAWNAMLTAGGYQVPAKPMTVAL